MNIALIFAGGSGTRMNSKARPKQFLQFFGKELIIHTLENFQNHQEIDAITIVCIEDWIPYLNKLLTKYDISKVRTVVAGGKTGQESIYKGLCATKEYAEKDSIILVHDGVRPFINEDVISACIKSVKAHGSAITTVPATETIITTENDKITSITDRSKCQLARAPQCFYLDELLEAHNKAIKDSNTNMIDSASLMKFYGHDLYTVQGNVDNIKITTPADFYTFKALYEVRENQQIFGL
ncbi:MAG: 2-C-methyl-D-erythritol 4-phosphate cytidylyltransferase [Treponema sp.]|uniref:2-C-methyl-D-erythritol 4-phosphate cytidylyltransferase n=1 Tax=Treponema sp. TaxID=166 RepID=UPI002A91A973|nr:2-C-methyl-D-erythritol 4-phosphate cytidylyltransferase [Treponema sp.]MDY6397572.1 2-C-methyl-D-erythritol 4-phosphate cytidylyltransferase [Treponema sp.]